LAIMFSACQDYLETPPYTIGNLSKEEVLNNAELCKGIVNAVYGRIPDRYNVLNGAMLAAGCDEAVNSNTNSTVNILNNGIWGPQQTIDGMLSNMYDGIRKANFVLENIAKSAVYPINATINLDSTIHRMRAEAFFLRAYYHFELVKRYGGIVLMTRVLDRTADLNLPRNTFNECVAQIVSDCDSAIVSLPLWTQTYNTTTDTKEMGRATKCAAMALKTRILLYAASPLYNPSNDITKWQKAADAAKVLIDKNVQSLLVFSSYGNIFNYTSQYHITVTGIGVF